MGTFDQLLSRASILVVFESGEDAANVVDGFGAAGLGETEIVNEAIQLGAEVLCVSPHGARLALADNT